MKAVLLYTSAPDLSTNAPPAIAGHRARIAEFAAAGTLLLTGPFADAQNEGAMSVFTTAEAAAAFAEGDPFVLTGVVSSWRVLEWNEVLASS